MLSGVGLPLLHPTTNAGAVLQKHHLLTLGMRLSEGKEGVRQTGIQGLKWSDDSYFPCHPKAAEGQSIARLHGRQSKATMKINLEGSSAERVHELWLLAIQ